MWAVIKFEKRKLSLLKRDLRHKLGQDLQIYIPKMLLEKYINNKIIKKEFNLLGDYLFCFHKKIMNSKSVNKIIYCRGLKYFLDGFVKSQVEIENFINKCKECENEKGYLTKNFFSFNLNTKYKFITGPFTDMIFKIVNLQKNKIDIYLGNLKTTINKKDFLFSQV